EDADGSPPGAGAVRSGGGWRSDGGRDSVVALGDQRLERGDRLGDPLEAHRLGAAGEMLQRLLAPPRPPAERDRGPARAGAGQLPLAGRSLQRTADGHIELLAVAGPRAGPAVDPEPSCGAALGTDLDRGDR